MSSNLNLPVVLWSLSAFLRFLICIVSGLQYFPAKILLRHLWMIAKHLFSITDFIWCLWHMIRVSYILFLVCAFDRDCTQSFLQVKPRLYPWVAPLSPAEDACLVSFHFLESLLTVLMWTWGFTQRYAVSLGGELPSWKDSGTSHWFPSYWDLHLLYWKWTFKRPGNTH